jgi:hypothetical protein
MFSSFAILYMMQLDATGLQAQAEGCQGVPKSCVTSSAARQRAATKHHLVLAHRFV